MGIRIGSEAGSAVVELGLRSMVPASAHASEAAEAVYDELLDHAHHCGHCWPWRSSLWRAERLCGAGLRLLEAYADAVVKACAGDEEDANAAIGVRLRYEPAARPVVLDGGAADA